MTLRLGFVALLLACSTSASDAAPKETVGILYFEDPRTGLCFAWTVAYAAYSPFSMTNVPCADGVRRLLGPQPKTFIPEHLR